ncbi:hypothetical protein O3M35_000221 [Rhynocoris fuscipes]|uniref:WD repeat-containing protein on Y chromosome n=1 Tax=Rhynocoris fuscipes TaxID=488301 RepID=A0AAW1DKS5_9HEMI
MEDEEVKSVVVEVKNAKSSESSLTYPKRYKLKLKAKVSEPAIDGGKVIEIFPKGYNELKLKVYSRIREIMDKRKKEEIEGKPKVRKMRTKRKRNILRERLNLAKADERGMGMLSILMLMEREAIKVKEKSYKRMGRALRQAASRRKAREAAKTEEKLEEERIKQEIMEHIEPPKGLKDEGEDYAPKIKAVIRRKIIKAKQKRQPKRNYIDKVLKIIRAKAKHQQPLDETGIDFLKLSPKTYEQTVDQFYEKIVEKIRLTNLLKLEKIFWINDYVMTKEKLINAFKDMRPPTEVTAIDLINLFIKLDKKNTGTITWFQFLYHLHLEIEQLLLSKHANMFADMFPPINGKPKYINPKFPGLVVAIAYCPYLKRAKYFSYTYGKYVTVNKYGQVTFWNLDMEPERSGQIEFHISGPLVTDIAYLADFQQIAFSTNDANLRIYDITAGRFQMSLMVEQFPRTILKLHYKFFAAEDVPSVLVCGLGNGSVVMIHFFAIDGSPFMFKSSNGIVDTVVLSYDNLMCGRFANIRIIEVKTLHNEPIMQMQLFPRTDTLITCCNSSVRSVAMIKYSTVQIRRSMDVPGGVSCFCVISRKKLIITGGLDKKIRVWHLTEEFPPIMVLAGHTSAITFIAQIYGGRRIYTIALNKNVKVWDFYSREAIMTFDIDFASSAKNKPFAICYNPYYRTLLVAEWKIGIIKFGYSINYKMCEGITHTKPVTAVLYNAIFEQIVTCGMDSRIFFWKSFTGEKLLTVNKAHIRRSYNEGEEVVSGITTAQFGPKYLFLFTGALDGTIRMWDSHYALCVRVLEFKTDWYSYNFRLQV